MADIKLGKQGINLPNPPKYKMASRAIRFFITSMITTLSATDMFPDKTIKVIVFVLGVVMLGVQAVDIFLGIQQNGNSSEADPAGIPTNDRNQISKP